MPQFRFSARNALIAMTLAAVWCGAFSLHLSIWRACGEDRVVMSFYYGIIGGLPATAVAALFGHWRLGIGCGVASALGLVALELASLS